MLNKLREMYKNGEKPIGTFLNVSEMSCVECLGYTGLDFVVIDGEHGPYDTESIMNMIRAAESVNLVPIVRIADATHKEVQRAADCGAQGLIVPCLRTVEEFKKLVGLAKFPPMGNRGFSKGRGTGFGNMDWATGSPEDYMAKSNERLMLLPQCETAESLENIEEIAKLEGVDGIFVGPFDLSVELGVPAQFTNPVFTAALERVNAACKAAGKPMYIYAPAVEDARMRLAQGADGVAVGIDAMVLTKAYGNIVKEVKAR